MVKSTRANSVSANQATKRVYSFGSDIAKGVESKAPLVSDGDVKEWEEARCPICLDHPHNAVLLQCSSYDKGCRPYICNTSYRHSNCLDQFIKSNVSCPSTARIEAVPSRVAVSSESMGEVPPSLDVELARELPWLLEQMIPSANVLQAKHACPLCRGQIYGWFVARDARKFMNGKTRACSHETCNFTGNYSELRKHARSDHPFVRPSEVDPQRQQNWTAIEREKEIDDLFGMMYQANDGGVDEPDFFRLLTLLCAANEAQQLARQEEVYEEEEDDDDEGEEHLEFLDESVITPVQLTDITTRLQLFNRQNYLSRENLNFNINLFPDIPDNWVNIGQNNDNYGSYCNYEPQLGSPSGITLYSVGNSMLQSNNIRGDRAIEWRPWNGQSWNGPATHNYHSHTTSHDRPLRRRQTLCNYRPERPANHPYRGCPASNRHYSENRWSTNNDHQSDRRFFNRPLRRWWMSDNYR